MKDSRQVVLLSLDDILPNRFQPRIKFDEKAIVELSESIKEHGVIQPIIVRKISDKYEIIAGERRYKASVMAGKSTIPAIIVSLNDKDSSEIALIENVQRQDLTPIEEAISYRKILDMGYLTQEALAAKLGVAQPTIANKLRLLNLDDEVQEALLDGKISERHARSLLKLEKSSMQRAMLKRIIEERLTVRKTDEEISNMMKNNEINMDSIENSEITPFENKNSNSTNVSENPFIIDGNNVTQPIQSSSNVEVLDFGFEEINPDKEAQELNNVVESNENNVNMPSAPIVEDIEPVVNTTEEAPVVSSSEVSQQDSFQNETNNQNIEADTFSNENYQPAGRFFTMVKPAYEEENTESVQDISAPNNYINSEPDTGNTFTFQPQQSIIEQPENNSIPTSPVPEVTENIFNTPAQFEEQLTEISPELSSVQPINSTYSAEPIQNIETPIIQNSEPQMVNTIIDDDIDINPQPINYTTSIPSQPVQAQSLTLRDVINKMRKCADEIEAMGFDIDTEEFDFDDMYQVIFKIKK